MANECHPVWQQFAFRRFGSGDSAVDLLRRYPPNHREEFGRYGVYSYFRSDSNGIPFNGLSVVTRDGKVLSADSGSCTWQFSFFHSEDAELKNQYAAFLKEESGRFARQRLGRLAAELQKFYSQHNRWPINPEEFSSFVTGSASFGTNDFGITLVQRPDEVMDISLVELPDEKRSVAKPVEEKRANP